MDFLYVQGDESQYNEDMLQLIQFLNQIFVLTFWVFTNTYSIEECVTCYHLYTFQNI